MTVEVAAGFDKAIAYARAAKVSLAAAFSDIYNVGDAASDLKRELEVINGTDMGAALSLGFKRARESMQTDG
jgi:hypothetical protein